MKRIKRVGFGFRNFANYRPSANSQPAMRLTAARTSGGSRPRQVTALGSYEQLLSKTAGRRGEKLVTSAEREAAIDQLYRDHYTDAVRLAYAMVGEWAVAEER